MKNMIPITLALLLLAFTVHAQPYAINWYKVSGGGGTSSNAPYSLSGTIGQQDAGGPMVNGAHSVYGGFWALYAVQSPGTPSLTIMKSGNSAIVSWPSPSTGYYLETNSNLANTNNWVKYTGVIVTNAAGTTNSVTITPPVGKLFFRLGPGS